MVVIKGLFKFGFKKEKTLKNTFLNNSTPQKLKMSLFNASRLGTLR